MHDPRFQDSAAWALQRAERCASGSAQLAEMGDATAIVAQLASGLGETCDLSGAADVSGLPEKLAADVERFMRADPMVTDGSHFALAGALAAWAFDGPPSAARLQRATEWLHQAPFWCLHAFELACARSWAQLDETTAEAWVLTLGAPPPLPMPSPKGSADIEVSRTSARWEIIDPFELWGEGAGAAITLVAAYSPLTVLRLVDPRRWFESIAAWKDGRLVFGALFGSHVVHGREALLGWLALAPCSFDAHDDWTGSTAAVVVAFNVIEHAAQLAEAIRTRQRPGPCAEQERDAELVKLSEAELPAYFNQAWQILLARSDGIVIALALLSRLSAPQSLNGHRHFDVMPIARDSLSKALAAQRLGLKQLRGLWERRRGAAETMARRVHASTLVGFWTAMTIAGPTADGEGELFAWFSSTLSETAEWKWFAASGAFAPFVERIADALFAVPNALALTERLYVSLERSRRRAEFGRGYVEADADLPSIVVLAVLMRLTLAMHNADLTAEAVAAAERTETRALRLARVSSPAFAGTFSPSAVLTEAIVIRARVDPDSVSDALQPILEDPVHAFATALALLSVMPQRLIQDAISGAYPNLAALAKRATEWSIATQEPLKAPGAALLNEALAKRSAEHQS